MERLATLDAEFQKRISRSSFNEAKGIVNEIVNAKVNDASSEVRDIIQKMGLAVSDLSPYILDATQKQVDDIDERYFDLEGEGRESEASVYFQAARLISVCMLLATSASNSELADAAYEALFAQE